jgi:hypothetical protein
MIPVPSDDDSILGRIVQSEPGTTTSFEAEARPNPCEQHLQPPREDALEQEIHRAQEIGGGAHARAMLHGFGFSAQTEHDTHLVFDVGTTKKVVRRDTAEYLACCRSHDCGFGYISTLVYGRGEYAAGRETRVQAEADYLGLAGGGGTVNVAASERRSVRGYVAAVVTPHEVLRNMDDARSRGFIAGGSAAFAVGLGALGLMAYGLARGSQLENDYRQAGAREQRDAISDDIVTANRIAIAGGVIGGLLTTAGATMLVVGVRGRQQRRFAVSPAIGRRMGVTAKVRF